jgi:hypothetical protein
MMADSIVNADIIANVETYLERKFNERLQVVPVVKPSTLQPHDVDFLIKFVGTTVLLGAFLGLILVK